MSFKDIVYLLTMAMLLTTPIVQPTAAAITFVDTRTTAPGTPLTDSQAAYSKDTRPKCKDSFGMPSSIASSAGLIAADGDISRAYSAVQSAVPISEQDTYQKAAEASTQTDPMNTATGDPRQRVIKAAIEKGSSPEDSQVDVKRGAISNMFKSASDATTNFEKSLVGSRMAIEDSDDQQTYEPTYNTEEITKLSEDDLNHLYM